MTAADFAKLPYLLTPEQVVACGYSRHVLSKYADCGVLLVIQPKGTRDRRFQKRQVAALNGWWQTLDFTAWDKLKPMVRIGDVCWWTGYDPHTILRIVRAGGLRAINPAGLGNDLYRKHEIGAWIGL